MLVHTVPMVFGVLVVLNVIMALQAFELAKLQSEGQNIRPSRSLSICKSLRYLVYSTVAMGGVCQ